MKIKFETEVTTERIKDLLCAAFEGGINYWASCSVDKKEQKKFGAEYYHEIPALGGEIELFDKGEIEAEEEYDGDKAEPLGVINLERIEKALKWMAEGKNEKGEDCSYLRKHFNDFLNENEDANTADLFVQLAVMGEVVYG